MTDDEFLRALETCTLPQADFGHAAHVRAGYLYLEAGDFGSALQRIRHTIRRYAVHVGKPGLYHETITVAYMALIHERIDASGSCGDWSSFARKNRELFDPGLLRRFYSAAQLDSDRARRVFLLPRGG